MSERTVLPNGCCLLRCEFYGQSHRTDALFAARIARGLQRRRCGAAGPLSSVIVQYFAMQ